jgi:hypothetical protein
MDTKETNSIEKQEKMPVPNIEELAMNQCAEEVKAVLDKWGCQLICQQQSIYGQSLYVPTITIKK